MSRVHVALRRRRPIVAAIAACLGLLLAGTSISATAQQQAWPTKVVKIVVPLTAGGAADALARPLAEALSKRLGQPVIIDNKPGVGGNLGTDFVAKAPADGYTLLLTPPAPIAQAVALYKKLPYDPQADLLLISDIAQPRVVCVVNASLPVKNFGELLAYAKAKPGALTIGSWGNGSQPHMVQSFMDLNFATQTLHVPYKGEAPMLADLIGGQVAMTCGTVTALKPHLVSGKLRALATMGPTRAAGLPEVPTFAESGFNQDVLRLTGPYSLLAPAKTPREVIERLGREVAAIVKSPEMTRQIEALGMESMGNTPAEAAAAYKARLPIIVKAIRDTGTTLD
ncbi:tripartite tricarboxylate transporter substrate binding protein [Variovorax humicola]|uniref:Tripartite tricarboxylate transporter substrate binding protein n=1 Tax=Variovorax humicola TaxID=1769758 RepID=A0ABU8VTB4_9BURK